MKKKIVIVIQGGVLQSVYSEDKDVQVELLDFDNAESENEDGTEDAVETMEEELQHAEETLHCVW